MNLALFMLTFMLSGLYATESYSQTVRISLNMKNSTVKEVLKKITTVQRNYPIGSVDLNRNHSSDVLV